MTEQLPGARGDRYQLQALLGKGGMGVVYAAFDKHRSQLVALKCLSLERFTLPKQRERAVALFEREYHALTQLTHPNIIEVYDYGRDDHGPYYTMEHLSGESLRARTPVPWQAACALMRDIVSALALLHSRSLVHRDLTPLNIYCAPDRPTKLLDFGAMMPAGVAKHLVGTPAFTAPECLQQQSLDGQADLYSVGACLYFAITGQHAYHVHTFEALQTAWQAPPRPLSAFVPDVPKALEELVLALLSLDARDRPRTAAEVYERLTVIANLPRSEVNGTAQSYVTKPSLLGRETELATLGQAAHGAAAGAGRSLFVRGARGLGRSRLLDAAVLEAKLAGLLVARADAAGGQVTTLGVASRLLGELTPHDPVLQSEVQALGLDDEPFAALETDARERMLHELSRALFGACTRRPCALIVDDVHAVDEASRAFLAVLAAQARDHALLIVCSSDEALVAPAGTAAALFAEYSQSIDLTPLDDNQSRALLVSMLGDVPNVDMLAAISQRHCRGNPQLLMESTRGLIEQQLLRYEGGQWLISHAPEAIAASIEQARGLAPRLRRLSADALELLEVVALDEHAIMDLTSYPWLLSHRDPARMHRALSELVDARWIELQEERVRLARDPLRRGVLDGVSPARLRGLYSQVAERCAGLGLPAIYAAYYRLRADQPVAALTALEAFSSYVEQHPRADVLRHPISLSVVDAVSRLPEVPGAHPAMRARYSMLTVLNALTYRGLPEMVAPRLSSALQMIAPFSGMSDYQALAHLPDDQRLARALTLASERCSAPGVGGMDVLAALRGQTRLCIAAALAANFMCDATLLDALPDLTPFLPLSPALGMAARVVDAASKLARGQTWRAWDSFRAAHSELVSPASEHIDPLTRHTLRGLVLGYLSALHADHGVANAPVLIDEYARYMPDNAEIQRSRFHTTQGDLSAAAASRRRFELLSVRMGSMSDARIVDLPVQLTVCALCDDSIGLRRTQLALQAVANTRSGWLPRATLAQAQLLRCQGSSEEGLRLIESLMATLTLACMDWSQAAATHLELLCAAHRWDTAVQLGREYLQLAREARVPDFRIELALCRACAALELHDEAELHYAHAVAQLEERGATGVLIGVAYEVGALIALARGAADAVEARLVACAAQFRLGKHPTLTARYNALKREADQAAQREQLSSEPAASGGGQHTGLPSISQSAATQTESQRRALSDMRTETDAIETASHTQ